MKDNEIYIVVDKSLCIWDDFESVINYYTHAYNVCKKCNDYYYPEYAAIVLDVAQGFRYSNPRNLKNCNGIHDYRGKGTYSYINHPFSKRMDIFEGINFWDTKIKKVLEVCDNYDIDYNNNGFKETDNETIKRFYMKLFNEFDVDANSIFFEKKDDSSFELIVSDKIKVNISRTDKIMDVLNNVEYIRKEIEKNKMKEGFELN